MNPYPILRLMYGGQVAGIPNSLRARTGQRQKTKRPNKLHRRKAAVRRRAR